MTDSQNTNTSPMLLSASVASADRDADSTTVSSSPQSPSSITTTTTTTSSSSSTSSSAVKNHHVPNSASQAHSLWSDYINLERISLVQESPQLDRKILGGFISNVLMRIAHSQDQGRGSSAGDADDEWHAALLAELSALRDYHPASFRIFADFVSRVFRRASYNGQASGAPYRPPNGSVPRCSSAVLVDTTSPTPTILNAWSHDNQRLPPISSFPHTQNGLLQPAALSPPKTTSYLITPSSNSDDYHHHYPTTASPTSNNYYSRSGTDPHLFSLESSSSIKSSAIKTDFGSSYLARPIPGRPTAIPNSTPQSSYPTTPGPSSLSLKRVAEDYLTQPPHHHPPQPSATSESVQKSEEMTMAAMLSEANALSVALGNVTAGDKSGMANEGRSLACLRCRRKKTRCNHARPTCSRCAHSGFKCEYPDPLPKPTDMASSIAKLQGQLQALNSRILAVEKKD